MRHVSRTVTAGGIVTAASWLGYLDNLVLLAALVTLFGMWVWSDKERTQRFNSSLRIIFGGRTTEARKTRAAVMSRRGSHAA